MNGGGAGRVGERDGADVDAGRRCWSARGEVGQRLEGDVGAIGRDAQEVGQDVAVVRADVDGSWNRGRGTAAKTSPGPRGPGGPASMSGLEGPADGHGTVFEAAAARARRSCCFAAGTGER